MQDALMDGRVGARMHAYRQASMNAGPMFQTGFVHAEDQFWGLENGQQKAWKSVSLGRSNIYLYIK